VIDRALLRRLLRGAGAVFVLTLLLVGVPAALWVLVGWPLPHALPTWAELRSALTSTGIPDEVLVKALALVCWAAWAVLTASVTAEVVGVLRGRGSRRIPFAGPLQTLAANLVAAIVLSLSPVASPVAMAPPLAAAVVLPLAQVTVRPEPAAPPCGTTAVQPEVHAFMAAPEDEPAFETYTVRRWDTLWGIADAHLGDPLRWPEVFELNRGRPQPDGGRLTEPGLIRPGWQLQIPLPRPATPSSSPGASNGLAGSQPPGSSTQETPGVDAAAPTSTAAASVTTTTTAPASVPKANAPSQADRLQPPASDLRRPDGPSVRLPGGSVVSLSLAAGVGASLAAARLHRRRRRFPSDPRPGFVRTDPLATPLVRRLRRVQLEHLRSRRRVRSDEPVEDSDETNAQVHADRRPGVVTIAERAAATIDVDLIGLGGLALEGEGALATARAVLVDLLSNSTGGAAEVIVAGSHLLDQLAPGVAPFPGLDIVPDLDGALTRLEVELVQRTRVLSVDDDAEVDFASYLAAHPEEPLPAVVLVAKDLSGGERLRLEAILTVGRRLGIAALVLGRCRPLPAAMVGDDGTIGTEAENSLGDLDQSRSFSLTAAEAAELLTVVAEARGEVRDVDLPDREPEPLPVEDMGGGGRVEVRLFGIYTIEVGGEEIEKGLRTKARELLAFLLLNPKGATAEACVDAVWPNADLARGMEGFRTSVGNLRKTFRDATGDQRANVVARVGDHYRLDTELFDCDVWRFQAALGEARATRDDEDAAAALERVADEYAGDLLAGSYYGWCEEEREDLRRRAVDALARLADLREDAGHRERALALLDRAVEIDRYGEELYRRIMRLQGDLGREDAVRRTLRLLESRLSELGVDPETETRRLAERLLRPLTQLTGSQ